MTSTLLDPPDSERWEPTEGEQPWGYEFDPDAARPPWRVLIGAVVLCGAMALLGVQGAVIVELLKEKEWQAVSEVEFRDPLLLPETVAVTLESPSIWHPIAEAEGLSDEEFQKNYDASVAGGTQIIQVSFIDPDPDLARRVTDGVVANYVEKFATVGVDDQRDVITGYIESLRELESSVVASLENSDRLAVPVQIDLQSQLVRTRQQINDLTLRLVQQEDEKRERTKTDPRIVSNGFILDEPVTPAPMKAAVFGAAAGGLIGILLSYLAFHRTALPGDLAGQASGFTGGRSQGSERSRRSNGWPKRQDRHARSAVPGRGSANDANRGRLGSRPGMIGKRIVDIFISATLLLLLWPLFLILAGLVRVTSPGPALFKQQRVGRNGEPFEILKLRTMRINNDDSQHRAHLERQLSDLAPRPEHGGTYKLDDPRVTSIGGLLRRLSLDELPQLWNVLRGDMSLVGPRPALAWEHRLFGDRRQDRVMAPPGCSGLWQVSGRSTLTAAEMLDLDLEYVRNWSLRRDLFILVRTPFALVRGDGAR